MASIPDHIVLAVARTLFVEAYEGAQGPATWFVNNEPDCGIFGTIDPLTAAQASHVFLNGGRSIAAHVEHLRWSLANVNGVARGRPWNPDWSDSWSVQIVNPSQWNNLRADLRQEYGLVLEALDEMTELNPAHHEMITGILAMAPHAAHHLGSIRMMANLLASPPPPPTA